MNTASTMIPSTVPMAANGRRSCQRSESRPATISTIRSRIQNAVMIWDASAALTLNTATSIVCP